MVGWQHTALVSFLGCTETSEIRSLLIVLVVFADCLLFLSRFQGNEPCTVKDIEVFVWLLQIEIYCF
jgi:hypothetical protein